MYFQIFSITDIDSRECYTFGKTFITVFLVIEEQNE